MDVLVHTVVNVSLTLFFIIGVSGLSGLVSPPLHNDPRDEIMRKYIIIM